MANERVEFDEIIEDLRDKLRASFAECGEECMRAYYPESGERDSQDHYATNALYILEPLIGSDFRDALRTAYITDMMTRSFYHLGDGERDRNDRYALVALSVAKPLIQELVDAGLGS